MVQKVVHIFFTERSWWSAYAKIVLWGESVLLERDIVVRLFFRSNLDFLTKCSWLNVLGLEFQTLCRQTFVRSGRCAYFSSSPMVFSVLLCERPGRLFTCILWYWSWLVKTVIKEITYHYLDSSFLLHGHPLWPVQCSHPKRVTSVVYITTMYMLHMTVVLVSAENGHKCLLLRT